MKEMILNIVLKKIKAICRKKEGRTCDNALMKRNFDWVLTREMWVWVLTREMWVFTRERLGQVQTLTNLPAEFFTTYVFLFLPIIRE